MGRIKINNFLIEWWLGDHYPKHVHIFKDGKFYAKIEIPSMKLLEEKKKVPAKIIKVIEKLVEKGAL